MRRDGPRSCACCGGPHGIEFCDGLEPRTVPLETPAHNGEYLGPVPVRVLAQGESGSGEFGPSVWGNKAKRGHFVQSRLQRQNRGANVNRLKTHCIHGHPFDEANTYCDNSGKRKCRACRSIRDAARRKTKGKR